MGVLRGEPQQMVGLKGGGALEKLSSSHAGVCRSVHFLGRLAIPVSRSDVGAELLVSTQHRQDDARVLVCHVNYGPVHVASFTDRVAPQVPERPMQRWSLDFVGDQLADYRRFRVLNIDDDDGRFCPGQIFVVSIPGTRAAWFLDDFALRIGLPEEIILDNGPEGTSKANFDWSERTSVRLRFIESDKPVQNAFVESFNGKFRDE